MRPAATSVKCVYITKPAHEIRRLAMPLAAVFPRTPCEPTRNNKCGPLSLEICKRVVYFERRVLKSLHFMGLIYYIYIYIYL